MTTADRPAEADGGSHGSLRHAALLIPPLAALAVLLVVIEVVAGFRTFGNPWQGGDLLYHSALANAVLRGEFPPGGPYAGLPAYYPPGFHVMLAAAMGVLGLGANSADQLIIGTVAAIESSLVSEGNEIVADFKIPPQALHSGSASPALTP